MRKLLFAAALVVSSVSLGIATEMNDCSDDVLPDGPKECQFRHVDAAQLTYLEGELTVRWPDFLLVEDSSLARNWRKMLPYEEGSTVRVEFNPGQRYDVVARFTDTRNGETFLGVTQIASGRRDDGPTRRDRALRALREREQGFIPRSCTIVTDVDCTDAQGNPAGTVAVECSGDTGSCSDDCSDSETACCSATSTTITKSGDGTLVSSSTSQERQQSCD